MSVKGKKPTMITSDIKEDKIVLPQDLFMLEKSGVVSEYDKGVISGYRKGYVAGYKYGFENPSAIVSKKDTTQVPQQQVQEQKTNWFTYLAIGGVALVFMLFLKRRR